MQNRIDPLAVGKPIDGSKSQDKKSIGNAAEAVSHQLAGLTQKVEQGIVKHPLLSLGIGLAIGATLGWFVKRK